MHYKVVQFPTENFIKNNFVPQTLEGHFFVPFVPRNSQGTKEAFSGCKIQNFSF